MIGSGPVRRDVLLVFGAAVGPDGRPSPTLRRRLEAAAEAGRGATQPLFIVSGAAARPGLPAEADVMRRTLIELGVPSGAIRRDPLSRDTLEQVRRCAALLEALPEAAARVVVCTSGFHQPRCRLLLRMLGVRAEGVPMPGERTALGVRGWLYYVLRECAVTPWDALLLGGLMAARRGRLPLTAGG